MALAPEAGLVDGAIVPNASDDILQNAPRRNMEEDIIGDDGWDAPRAHATVGRAHRGAAHRSDGGGASAPYSGAVAESLDEAAKMQRANVVRLIGHKYRDQALAISDNIRPIETAPALCHRAFCQATAADRAARKQDGRWDRRGSDMPWVRSRWQPTIRRTPVVFAASWARTMPAS
jgi:hypothetical protein